MKQLGYKPNNSNLTIQNSRSIGIILPVSEFDTYENSFFLETMRGITLFCNQKHYSTTLITGSSNEEIIDTIQYLSKDHHLDGVVLLYSQKDGPVIDYLEKESIPFVLVGKTDQSIHDTIYVDDDNILAGKDATNYLLDLGHTRIGYLGSLSVRIYSADRKSGYILALTEAGIPHNPAMCIELPSIPKEGDDELTEFLSSENRPTALVVSDDIIAMVIEKTAYELGLRIPEDLSIVSFNNSLFATKIIVPYYLVERQSCCLPKQ